MVSPAGTTMSLRRLVVLAAALLAGLALAAVVVTATPAPQPAPAGGDPPAAASTPSATGGQDRDAPADAAHAGPSRVVADRGTAATAGRTAPGRAESTSTPATRPSVPVGADERARGRQAAADFVAAYATFRHDESDGERMARLRPLATDELAAVLARDAGGRAGKRQLAAHQQVTTATVAQTQLQTVRDGRMAVLVIVRLDRSSVDGQHTEWASHLTRVVRTPRGWKVDRFQP